VGFSLLLVMALSRLRRPGVVLTVIVLLYSARTYVRNQDWESEETLWSAALRSSPKSFHPYQALALCLYEADPAGNLDRSIDLAERGVAVLDGLPDSLNVTRLYMHLALYYAAKAERLNLAGAGIPTPEAAVWYRKAVRILERSVPIDRAFNRIYKKRFLK